MPSVIPANMSMGRTGFIVAHISCDVLGGGVGVVGVEMVVVGDGVKVVGDGEGDGVGEGVVVTVVWQQQYPLVDEDATHVPSNWQTDCGIFIVVPEQPLL